MLEPYKKRRINVAYSGGNDSTALLSVIASLRESFGLRVRALHVNHDWTQSPRFGKRIAKTSVVTSTYRLNPLRLNGAMTLACEETLASSVKPDQGSSDTNGFPASAGVKICW